MLQKKKGIEIVTEIGGIITFEAASKLFENKLDPINLSRIQKIKHSEVVIKIANAIAMCEPEAVFINTGSKEDKQHIREMAINKGEETKLPMDKHTIHYDLKYEQAA